MELVISALAPFKILKTLNKVLDNLSKLSLEIGFGQFSPLVPEKSGSENFTAKLQD